MRGAFAKTLLGLAERDPRVLLLTGDLGFMVVEPFAHRFPDRFFNVGVAEQNMVGLATGLAEAGFIPFIYSIVTFATLRPYEFIRNGPVLHRLPVRIVGVGGGFEYGPAGITHYGLEDIGVMRLQPDLMVIAPADYQQTRTALLQTWDLPGPIYFRLGKDDKTIIPGLEGRFDLGRIQLIRRGEDLLLITTGHIASEVATAAETLADQGISCAIAIVSSWNPAPVDDLINLLMKFPLAMTIEAHYLQGGLSSLVCELVAEQDLRCQIIRCGVASMPRGSSGSEAYLHSINGLASDALAQKVCDLFARL